MHDSSAGTYFFNDKTDKWPRKKDKKTHQHCNYDQIWSQETSKLITSQVSHLNIVASNQIFKKGGGGGGGGVVLTGPQLLEGGFWERGGDFFQRRCHFHIKIN